MSAMPLQSLCICVCFERQDICVQQVLKGSNLSDLLPSFQGQYNQR